MRLNTLLLLSLVASTGCYETGINRRVDPKDPLSIIDNPCIDVDPQRLVFNDIDLTENAGFSELPVTISNLCEGDLLLNSLEIEGPDAGVFDFYNLESVMLKSNDTAQVTVRFEPPTSGEFSSRLVIGSNDPEKPTTAVRISGAGISPVINLTPSAYDVGAPFIGCEVGNKVTITNAGNADLVVDNVELFTASSREMSLDLNVFENGTLPFLIEPYDSREGGPAYDVFFDYVALDTFSDSGFGVFYSNDPLMPEAAATLEASGTRYGDNLDIYEQPVRSATDILFTLDRSCSMYDNNESVISNFDVFVETLSSLDADYHAAVAVADDGCIVGPDPYIDNTFAASQATRAFGTMADLSFNLSTYGRNTERGYMLAEAALSNKNTGVGGCNSEFYREDAFLSLVHVSDEPEQSINSWAYYVNLFQSMKRDPEDVKINAVAGDYPSGCAGAGAGTGYYEGVTATGGLFLSICSTDWAEKLEELATESISINDSFELTQQPVPQTVEVKIDGIRISTGWVYDATSNAVVFDNDFIPPGGSTIEVAYERLPDCEG